MLPNFLTFSLKVDEVLGDVMKIKPEPKKKRGKAIQKPPRKKRRPPKKAA
jgi:hypothetical protein